MLELFFYGYTQFVLNIFVSAYFWGKMTADAKNVVGNEATPNPNHDRL